MVTESLIEFRTWLQNTQKLRKRSAGDLISRRNKLLGLVSNPENFLLKELKAQLQAGVESGEYSKSTLSAMIRSEELFRKFKVSQS